MKQRMSASPAVVALPAEITSLAQITKSATVAAGLANGEVAVWNGRDAAPALLLKAHSARVLAIASTADGRELWTLASDGSLARMPVASGATPTSRTLDASAGEAAPRAAAFSSDAAMLVTGGDHGEIRVFDTASGAMKRAIRAHRTELQALAVRPRSSIVATASAEADLRIWDAASGRQIGSIEYDVSVFALDFSPTDGTLASGGADRRLTLSHPSTFKRVGEVRLKKPRIVGTLAWSPDGRLIALGDVDDESLSKGGIDIVEVGNRSVFAGVDTKGVPPRALVFAAEGGMLFASMGRSLLATHEGA